MQCSSMKIRPKFLTGDVCNFSRVCHKTRNMRGAYENQSRVLFDTLPDTWQCHRQMESNGEKWPLGAGLQGEKGF